MFTVLDSGGTATYTRGDPIVFSDPGVLSYTGYVQSDQPTKDGLSLPFVEHIITCMDGVYKLGKRTNSQNYINWRAGSIAIDFVRRDLGDEGITITAASHRDTTVADFNQGNLNGLAGVVNGTDDGDLQFSLAGTTVTIKEATQADFTSGTLTNVSSPASGGLTPTITPTLQLIGTGTGTVYVAIWAGSQVIGTSDTLIYATYNDPVAGAGSISFTCSDGTNYQQFVGTDTTTNPATGWWNRVISLPSNWNGKTITQVQAVMTNGSGTTPNAYFQNVRLGSASGSPFFSTTLNLTSPFAVVLSGYTNVTTQVENASLLGATTMRSSPAYSIAAAGILQSAYLSYSATTPSSTTITIKISSDGGATWYPCTNNAFLPTACVTPGMNLSGISLLIQEIFANTSTDPTLYATLTSLTLTIQPAPQATKTDVSYVAKSQADWLAGTLTNVVAQSNGTLTIASTSVLGTSNHFDNGGLTYAFGAPTDNRLFITMPFNSAKNTHTQLTGPGTYSSMTYYMSVAPDVSVNVSGIMSLGPTYLSPQWNSTAGTFGYCAMVTTTWTALPVVHTFVSLIRGSAGGSTTTLAGPIEVSHTYSSYGTNLKVVYSGGNHKIYANNILVINVSDSTFTTPANVGLYASTTGADSSGGPGLAAFDNFAITPNASGSGTFVSPSTSLAPVVTYGTSLVDWSVLTPSVLQNLTVEASIDNGATYALCTNGLPIPGIVVGTSMSGKNLKMRVTLLSQVISNISTINGLRALVIGQYAVTGTRNTAPTGNDMSITRIVGSGWGPAFDGQTWVQVGTGTTAVGSGSLTITNTTGDVHMRLGTRTAGDEDTTVRVSLSASTINPGVELRITDANTFYRLSVTTTAMSIIKKSNGVTTTLKTVVVALSTGTPYYLRFRVSGFVPASLFGRVWAGGTLEPAAWTATITD